MAIPLITISGLNADRYLINNPIWVDFNNISANTKYVIVSTAVLIGAGPAATYGTPTSLRFYPNAARKIYFDLAELVKSFFPEPQHPDGYLANASLLGTNYLKVKITIQSVLTTGQAVTHTSYVKNFMRGGSESYRTNEILAVSAVLKESSKLPRWAGYPLAKYALDTSANIRYYSIISAEETVQRKVIGCNPVYIRFLNTKGGYSFWLFEQFELKKKSKKPDTVKDRTRTRSLGNETEWELIVESRVEAEYFATMRALAESPEVHAYGLTSKIFADLQASGKTVDIQHKFEPIINPGNSADVNSFEKVQSFKFSFDIPLTHNPRVIW